MLGGSNGRAIYKLKSQVDGCAWISSHRMTIAILAPSAAQRTRACSRMPSSSSGIATARQAGVLCWQWLAQWGATTGTQDAQGVQAAGQHSRHAAQGVQAATQRTHSPLDAPSLGGARRGDAVEYLLGHIQQLMDCTRRAAEHATPGRRRCSRSIADGALRRRGTARVPEVCRRLEVEQTRARQERQ